MVINSVAIRMSSAAVNAFLVMTIILCTSQLIWSKNPRHIFPRTSDAHDADTQDTLQNKTHDAIPRAKTSQTGDNANTQSTQAASALLAPRVNGSLVQETMNISAVQGTNVSGPSTGAPFHTPLQTCRDRLGSFPAVVFPIHACAKCLEYLQLTFPVRQDSGFSVNTTRGFAELRSVMHGDAVWAQPGSPAGMETVCNTLGASDCTDWTACCQVCMHAW